MHTRKKPLLTVCGLDGVLAPLMGTAAQSCDLAAAQLFCMLGGKLTVFTHRAPAAVRAALGRGTTSLPAVTCGGALLYDLNKDCLVQSRPITVEAGRRILNFVREEMEHTGVVGVNEHGQTYLLQASREAQVLLNSEGGEYHLAPPDADSPSWCKLSICAPAAQIAQFKHFMIQNPDLPVSVLRYDLCTLELVAAQVQPRETFRELCRQAGCLPQDVAAVTTQPQDLPWAACAGQLLTMNEAPEVLQASAHERLGYYYKGAMGAYLYDLAADLQPKL